MSRRYPAAQLRDQAHRFRVLSPREHAELTTIAAAPGHHTAVSFRRVALAADGLIKLRLGGWWPTLLGDLVLARRVV